MLKFSGVGDLDNIWNFVWWNSSRDLFLDVCRVFSFEIDYSEGSRIFGRIVSGLLKEFIVFNS